ncbi:hypothetical protein CRUP_007805 [Coryphaenoides rupestris]|nr:hypothetical protein CRUP_007805 [Coryphaenoides rupestris]
MEGLHSCLTTGELPGGQEHPSSHPESPHGDPQPKSPSTRQPRQQQQAPPQKAHGTPRQTKQSRRTHHQRKRLKHQQQSIESAEMTEGNHAEEVAATTAATVATTAAKPTTTAKITSKVTRVACSSSEVPVSSATGSIPAGQETPEGTPKQKRERKPQRPGKYVCSYCGRACAKPSVLQKHIRSHTGERPYPCAPCGFSFKTKSNLYKHRKSHTHRVKAGLAFSDPRSLEEQATESEDEAKQLPPPTSGMEHQGSTTSAKSHESDRTKDSSRGMDDSYAVKKRLAMRLSRGKLGPLDSSDERVSSSHLGSRGSTESGYFSRSESTEQSQDSPPNTSAKSYAEIILGKYGRFGHLQRMSRHQNQQLSGEEEKNIPFTVPKKQVIDHITKLITINEAVVDTKDSNMDTQSSSKAISTSMHSEKLEEFQWPQRSPTLAQLPIEKLPPKKKRLRLAEIAQSSGESSFESVSHPHSPSQDSSTSYASSRSASIEESGRVDLEVTIATPLRKSRAPHMLTVPGVHQHREMRRSASEQAPHDSQQGVLMFENRSKSFDYSCLSPERSAVGWRERRKCLLLKHSAIRDPEEEEEQEGAVRLQADTLHPACAIYTMQSQTTPAGPSRVITYSASTATSTWTSSTHQGRSNAESPDSPNSPDWSEDLLRSQGTGGSKRMLSPSNSVEFSPESRQQQKRVKEEEEVRGVKDKALVEAGCGNEDDDHHRQRPSTCSSVEQIGVSFPSLESSTRNSWCYLNYIKPNPFALDARRPSVYSSWSTSSYNPNPLGLSSRVALSLLQCKQSTGPSIYTTAPMCDSSVETIRAEDHQRPPSTEVSSSSLSCDREHASTRDKALLSADDRSSNKGDDEEKEEEVEEVVEEEEEEEEEGPNQAAEKEEEHQPSAKYRHPSQPWTCNQGTGQPSGPAYARGEHGTLMKHTKVPGKTHHKEAPPPDNTEEGVGDGPSSDRSDEPFKEFQHSHLPERTGTFHINNNNNEEKEGEAEEEEEEEEEDADNSANTKGCRGIPSASPANQNAGAAVGRAPRAGSRRALFARRHLPPPPPGSSPPGTAASPDRLPPGTCARSPPAHLPVRRPRVSPASPDGLPRDLAGPFHLPVSSGGGFAVNWTLPSLRPDTLLPPPPPRPPRTSRGLLSHLPLHSQGPTGGASPGPPIVIGGIHMIQPRLTPPYRAEGGPRVTQCDRQRRVSAARPSPLRPTRGPASSRRAAAPRPCHHLTARGKTRRKTRRRRRRRKR